MSVTLGCGPVTAAILERGGHKMADLGPMTDINVIEWNRRLDRTSYANVYVNAAFGCCGWWDEVVPYKHELALYRDGKRFWRGPVTSVRFVRQEFRQVAINAADTSHWFDVRILNTDAVYPQGTDLAIIAANLIEQALNADPSPNIAYSITPCGAVITDPEGRRYLGSQHRTILSIIDELARTGFDWTIIDGNLIGGGAEIPVGYPPLFLFDEHFREVPDVGREGPLFAARFYVVGNGRGEAGDTVVGSNALDPSIVAEYGLVERVIQEWDIRDAGTAALAAESHYEIFGRNGPPIVIAGAKLNDNAPVNVESLIPGRRVMVSIQPCPDVRGEWRLSSVDGYHGPESDTIAITLEPIGTTDHRISTTDYRATQER